MKRAFIVHGWDFKSSMNWYPWLKKELERKGFRVFVPEMPNSPQPKIEDWVAHLKSSIGKLDEDTYLVGHSIGCQTIMRYLEKEKFEGKLPKIIFVAGWFKLENLEDEDVKNIAKPWLETPIYFNKIADKIQSLTIFLSDNEPYGCIEDNKKIFQQKLNAKVIISKGKGHFTEEDGVTKLPEILSEF